MSAEAYLSYLLIDAPYEHPFRPDEPVPCPGCASTRFHAKDCDAAERWAADARRLFVRGLPCPLCHGEFVVPVGPPDEFGNVDFDDCDCVKP